MILFFNLCLFASALAQAQPGDLRSAPALEQHWAFRLPVRPELPKESGVNANPVDILIAKKQRELGLKPLPEADRRTLIRRLALDLTGLPPSPEELSEFLSDSSPDAYSRLVERLLASPRYGERWGRFWLDLARWAESDGFEANEIRSSAWRYRDYVVNAFNTDKPYDQFLREQIAGDELTPYSDENLIATGFLAAGRSNNNEEDKIVQLNGPRVDMANTVASVTLGLTLSCAQCHDHKFEPLSMRDYYSFHGFFVRGQVNNLVLRDPALMEAWEKTRPPELATAKTLLEQLIAPVRARLENRNADTAGDSKITDEKIRNTLNDDDRKLFDALKKKVKTLEDDLLNRKPHIWGYYSPGTSPHSIENLPPRGQYPFQYKPANLRTNQPFILVRGDPHRREAALSPGLPLVLDPGATNLTTRAELAEWLASDSNPLTARVWVNFVWQQHFGRGLVETSGDFGLKGAKPANQELLDWLACEFRKPTHHSPDGPLPPAWSTKHLHRLILTTAAYRRTSQYHRANAEIDPTNRHLWRWEPRRLESEALRDSILAVSGCLDSSIGGPSHVSTNAPSLRRSLYLRQQRNLLPAMQAVFDAPTANESCPRRHTSTVALQPLHLLNNSEIYRWAELFAERVAHEAGRDVNHQVERACQLALNRSPDATERDWCAKFFAEASAPNRALTHFCHALLNLNEFAYLE